MDDRRAGRRTMRVAVTGGLCDSGPHTSPIFCCGRRFVRGDRAYSLGTELVNFGSLSRSRTFARTGPLDPGSTLRMLLRSRAISSDHSSDYEPGWGLLPGEPERPHFATDTASARHGRHGTASPASRNGRGTVTRRLDPERSIEASRIDDCSDSRWFDFSVRMPDISLARFIGLVFAVIPASWARRLPPDKLNVPTTTPSRVAMREIITP